VATQTNENLSLSSCLAPTSRLVIGGQVMVDGLHYWEVLVTGCLASKRTVIVGAIRPPNHLDQISVHQNAWHAKQSAFGTFIEQDRLWADLHGARKRHGPSPLAEFSGGVTRVGCLLNLEVGSLHFYCDGVRCGGIQSGVTGPLVHAVELYGAGQVVTVQSGAEAPEGDLL
jgi:hypothetical protein